MSLLTESTCRWPKNIVEYKHKVQVGGMNLQTDFNDNIENVLIIPGPFTHRAIKSVNDVGMNPIVLDSFYYPDNMASIDIRDYYSDVFQNIQAPKNFNKTDWPYQVKLYSGTLKYYDVCRILNHMIAWDYSIRNNEPVVILENDAILYREHNFNSIRTNAITLLGDIKLHRHTDNWICGAGVYAYSVDFFSAKNLFNKVMAEGIVNPLELMFRFDEFDLIIQKKACRFQELASSAAILLSN